MKKETTSKQEAPEINVDPNLFGYEEGVKAPFEGNLVLWVMNFAQTVALKETSTVYETGASFEETRKTGKEQVTDLGLQGLRILELLTAAHLDNIDEGIALHQDVLTGKVQKKEPVFEMKAVKTED